MAIVKSPDSSKQITLSVDGFIGCALDSAKSAAVKAPAPKARVMKGHQAQITLAMLVDLLERANAMAYRFSISRAAFMKQAIFRVVELK